jgi:thiol-disulfide isomerase/thioredoxin
MFLFQPGHLFAQKKANMEGINTGSMSPEIVLPTVEGEIFHLSQLKGKIVLINFWASWCSPCIKKTPQLLDIYGKYKDTEFVEGKGFEIVAVSLDRNEAYWKKSIIKNGMDVFRNIGDMRGWKCTAAELYNIKLIPSNVLIDGEGKIIAVNLSPKDLNKKLRRMKQTGRFWF